MSHVDDGTLHAYLDGELTPVERERLDAHLAGCGSCRARLEEERALVERAGRLLGLAAPPPSEAAMPPFHALRRRGGRGILGRYRLPLAWAATIALALGMGWYARGLQRVTTGQPQAARATKASDDVAAAPAPSTAPTAPHGPIGAQRDEPARSRAATSSPAAGATPMQSQAAGAAEAPTNALVLTAPPTTSGAVMRRSATTWPVVEPNRARDVLGEEPAVIPGYPVRVVRNNPTDASEIVVEQAIDGAVIQLFERRSALTDPGARPPAGRAARADGTNERLARYVGSLRIEIAGPASPDSLSRLLDLIRLP